MRFALQFWSSVMAYPRLTLHPASVSFKMRPRPEGREPVNRVRTPQVAALSAADVASVGLGRFASGPDALPESRPRPRHLNLPPHAGVPPTAARPTLAAPGSQA